MKEIDIVTAMYLRMYADENPGIKRSLGKEDNLERAGGFLLSLHQQLRKGLEENDSKGG